MKCSTEQVMFALGSVKSNCIFVLSRNVKSVLNTKHFQPLDCFSGLGGSVPGQIFGMDGDAIETTVCKFCITLQFGAEASYCE